MKYSWNNWQGKTEVLEDKLSQCHSANHKSQWTTLGANMGLRGEKPATNHLSQVWCSHTISEQKNKLTNLKVGA